MLDLTYPEPAGPVSVLAKQDNLVITVLIESAKPRAVAWLCRQAAGAVSPAVQGKRCSKIVNGVNS